jgi:hypothetical protein
VSDVYDTRDLRADRRDEQDWADAERADRQLLDERRARRDAARQERHARAATRPLASGVHRLERPSAAELAGLDAPGPEDHHGPEWIADLFTPTNNEGAGCDEPTPF